MPARNHDSLPVEPRGRGADPRRRRVYAWVVRTASILVIVAAVLTLVGWATGSEILRQNFIPGQLGMAPNTAVGFILSGAALWLLAFSPARAPAATLGRVLAVGAGAIGLITLLEYITGADLWIDRILFEAELRTVPAWPVGRIAPNTAFSFTLVGLALLGVSGRGRGAVWLEQMPALLVAVGALQALVGYAYGVEPLYGIERYTPMGANPAAAFLAVAIGILFARPYSGAMAVVTAPDTGGMLARRLLPAAILIPFLLGVLRVAGSRAGLFDPIYGLTLVIVLSMVAFTALVWIYAAALHRLDGTRRRTMAALRASELRFRSLNAASPVGIFLTDTEPLCTYTNPRCQEICGFTFGEALGTGWARFVHPADRRRVARSWTETSRAGRPYEDEFRWLRPDGTIRWTHVRSAPLRDERGELIGHVGTVEDVTERRRVEEERARLLEDSERKRTELQALLESRGRLMRGFSHDVKNPLGAAEGQLALLEEGVFDGLGPGQREGVARARRSIGSALRLIDTLVDLARAEAGAIGVDLKATDISAVAREIGEEYRAAAEAQRLEMVLDVPERVPPAHSDPDRVHQILGNLLSNAVKYTPAGGRIGVRVRERLRERAPRRGRWVCVDIWDTGPGIPPDKHGEVFAEFTRLGPPDRRGAGLGLAISRRIARLLGGDVTLESEPGRGAVFTVWLPTDYGWAGTERPLRREATTR